LTEHAVVIAGGGPTGMMLAGELALAGIDAAIVERRVDQDLTGARAGGLHSRTIEELDQRGIADRFLSQGKTAQIAGFAWIPLNMSDLPTRHPYGLALWQSHIERILAEWIDELGVPVYREREVTGFSQDDAGVDVAVSNGEALRASYLVGCDGGRSLVRKAAGIDFPGWDATVSHIIAEVELAEEPEWGLRRDDLGIRGLSRMENGPVRVMVTERNPGRSGEPSLDDLRAEMVAAYGTDYGVHSPKWISRFTDMARQAASYRAGRVLIAGDAAHVHYPAGGQGLNTGVQDAMNLGWKLAQVVRGVSPETLLDSYHAERHPIAAGVLRNTLAQVALLRGDERTNALRDTVTVLLGMDEPRRRVAADMSGLNVRYDLGEGHPLLGRRMPDLDLVTADGQSSVFALLRDARPVLLDFRAFAVGETHEGALGGIDIAPWADRVRSIKARCEGPWELPVVGTVAAPAAVLVRPDGYVAWVGNGTVAGLSDALTTWFGPPAIG
jgi:3-(3-hydroxy-phenyl)propionate hydroxylase